jgi:hypothetical protein
MDQSQSQSQSEAYCEDCKEITRAENGLVPKFSDDRVHKNLMGIVDLYSTRSISIPWKSSVEELGKLASTCECCHFLYSCVVANRNLTNLKDVNGQLRVTREYKDSGVKPHERSTGEQLILGIKDGTDLAKFNLLTSGITPQHRKPICILFLCLTGHSSYK